MGILQKMELLDLWYIFYRILFKRCYWKHPKKRPKEKEELLL